MVEHADILKGSGLTLMRSLKEFELLLPKSECLGPNLKL